MTSKNTKDETGSGWQRTGVNEKQKEGDDVELKEKSAASQMVLN